MFQIYGNIFLGGAMRILFHIVILLLMLTSPAYAQYVTVMSFNVENLFDVEDDPINPHDNTYLPLATKQENFAAHTAQCEQNNSPGFYRKQCLTLDWSEAVYNAKLEALAEIISAAPGDPAIIVLPETENAVVLDDLVEAIGQGSYPTKVQLDTSDKPDSRGIDVGIISRLPLADAPTAHKINFGSDAGECGKTRDIVQAAFTLPDGDTLHVFGVHFPSGGNPIDCRVRAMLTLNKLAEDLPEGELAMAAGDFNFSCSELQSDAFERLAYRGNWYFSPVIRAGCNAPGSSKYVERTLYNWNTWSFLDLILVSPELSVTQSSVKNWFADLGSFQTVVVSPKQVMTDDDDEGYMEPRRYDPETMNGVSDHWPVMMRLLRRRP